jgi:hypothetical protein
MPCEFLLAPPADSNVGSQSDSRPVSQCPQCQKWRHRDICRARVETQGELDRSGGSHWCVLIHLARYYLSMLIWLDVTSGGPITLNLAVTLFSNSCCLPTCATGLRVMHNLGYKSLCSNQVSKSHEQRTMESPSPGRSRSRNGPDLDFSWPPSRQDPGQSPPNLIPCIRLASADR